MKAAISPLLLRHKTRLVGPFHNMIPILKRAYVNLIPLLFDLRNNCTVVLTLHILWSHPQKYTANVLLPSLFYLQFFFLNGSAAYYEGEAFLDITACLMVPQKKNLIEFNQFKLLNL